MFEKRRVLILIPRMGGGGAERVVSIIANNLCDRYQIQIATLVSADSFYELNASVSLVSAGFDITRSSKIARCMSMGRKFIKSISYVRKIISEFKPDIIFSLLEEMDIVSYFATIRLRNIIRINSERNDPLARNRWLSTLLKKIYGTSDMLVCQSETVAQYYKNVPHKIVIPNPVDFSSYPKRVSEGQNTRIVGVGRLREQKNFLLLEKAFARISKQFPKVSVVIYGEGPERKKLEEESKRDGLEGRFFLPGASKDILNEIKDATVFAFPTNYEGFPNALIEAISMGIPVVTTDFSTGIARDIVNDEVGIVVPVGDIDGFAEGLKELLSDKARRDRIRVMSRKAVEPFALERVKIMWDNLFRSLLEAR